jgi:DNA polymerase III delta prime subunit
VAKNAFQTVLSNLKAGRDILIGDVKVNFSLFGQRSSVPGIDLEVATQLLERQSADVENRLEQMLFGIAEIGLPPSPQDVAKLAATKILKIEQGHPEMIDPLRPILEVYDRPSIKGSLLILGTPGAGKTTTLLSLAKALMGRELVNIQQSSPKAMIPLIFELSTWRDDQQSIGDWLVAKLYEDYGGDRKARIYETWLEQQVLLPLLDGLDELGLVRQQKCTEQLNQFAKTYPQLVVCCRVKEFRQVEVKLSNLRGAVQLEPLSDQQIQAYLADVGKSALWEQIQTVPGMHNLLQPVVDPENTDYDEPGLLRVPLFISLAAQVFEADRPLRSKADLLDRYIDRQLSVDVRRSDRRRELEQRKWAYATVEKEPAVKATRQYLTWLAQRLNAICEVDFLIETMQPSWLEKSQYRRLYKRVYGLSIGLISGLIGGLIGGLSFGLKYWLIFGLATGLMGWLICGSSVGLSSDWIDWLIYVSSDGLNDIKPIESFQISMSSAARRKIICKFKSGLRAGLIFGLPLGLPLGLGVGLNVGLVFGLIVGLFLELSSGLIGGLIVGLIGWLNQDLKIRSKPNQGIWNSLYNFCFSSIVAIPLAILFIPLPFLITAITKGVPLGVLLSLLVTMLPMSLILGCLISIPFVFDASGGKAFVQHFCLRFVLAYSRAFPFFCVPFLNYCHERRLLQQIGGRYRFIHRELLDHFANQSTR